jgi:polyisoprenyl-teichoic acid--peptidoglycan teichoic acid transferase
MAEPPRHRRTGQPPSGRQPWEARSPGRTPPPAGRPTRRAPGPGPAEPGSGGPCRRNDPGYGNGARGARQGDDTRYGTTGGARRGAAPGYGSTAGSRRGAGAGPRRPSGARGGADAGRPRQAAPRYRAGSASGSAGSGGWGYADDGRSGSGPPGSPGRLGPGGSRPRGRRTWPQRIVLGIGGVIVGMSLLAASVAGYTLIKYESIDRLDDLDVQNAASGQPENYLIVAVDTRQGQESVNTDTIMVARIDPQSDRVALTSFNRDLMVTIADTGRTGMINAAYSRPDGSGAQNLINTIKQNFDIDINHFIAVDFQSFQEVVDAVGGVNMYFPYPVRDTHSGLYQYDVPACVTLNGEQGLAFARSRYFQIMDANGRWVSDGSADLGRVQRQQVFIQRAMAKALSQVKSNPLRLRELVDIGVSNVTLDPNLTIGDMLDLAEHFQDFDSEKLEAYALPVKPYPADENRVLLDDAAEEYLNVFRGVAPGEVRPAAIEVSVLNGTQGANPTLAGDTSSALQQIGFDMGQPQDAQDLYERSIVFYAPGQLTYGQRVARHLTTPVELREDPELASGQVRLIAGTDFTTVHEDPAPVESLAPPVAAEGQPATPTSTPPASETTATTIPPPTTTTTEPTGFVVGEPPDGQEC